MADLERHASPNEDRWIDLTIDLFFARPAEKKKKHETAGHSLSRLAMCLLGHLNEDSHARLVCRGSMDAILITLAATQ